MTLSPEEVERYARHLVLQEVGGPGQQALKRASVLVVGAGGLGSPVILYLAAAGVGTIHVVDDDAVSLSNLQRQVLHGTDDIGRAKVASAADAVGRLNPHTTIVPHQVRLSEANVGELLAGVDVVADGSDNFATRYLVSDACAMAEVPLVTAAVSRFDGAITTLAPFEAGPDGRPRPTYRCLYPEAPPADLEPPCATAGILGVVTGVVGTLQAAEVLKRLLGVGEPLYGKLLCVSVLGARFEVIDYEWDPANPLTGSRTKPLSRAPAQEKSS
ncbi:MAG: molybdopterin-synthase adenylyltransferase MoeB [Devosia sp.]